MMNESKSTNHGKRHHVSLFLCIHLPLLFSSELLWLIAWITKHLWSLLWRCFGFVSSPSDSAENDAEANDAAGHAKTDDRDKNSETLSRRFLRWLKDRIRSVLTGIWELLSEIRLAGKRALIRHVHSLVAASMVAFLVVFTLVGSLFVTIRIIEESSRVAVEVKGVFESADLPEW